MIISIMISRLLLLTVVHDPEYRCITFLLSYLLYFACIIVHKSCLLIVRSGCEKSLPIKNLCCQIITRTDALHQMSQ